MTFAHNFRAAFLFLVLACFIDSTDGVLARAVRVKERLPDFDGAKLDDIVDYPTYVFVPALIVWQAELVPLAFPICAAILLSSAYGFVQSGAKVESHDHFFTGFPSWNIVVVYLYRVAAAATHQCGHPRRARNPGVPCRFAILHRRARGR
ncbi:MAG: CDP-alcohol phosphatidyltransferase family protein [Hymenobacter sp.]